MKKKCIGFFIFVLAIYIFMPTMVFASLDDVPDKITLKSIPLTNMEYAQFYCDYLNMNEAFGGYLISIDPDNPNKATIGEHGSMVNPNPASKEVDVVYDYDENVKKVADKLIEKIGTEHITFELNDIESFNFYLNYAKFRENHPGKTDEWYAENRPSIYAFSNDFKELVQYSNFDIYVGSGIDSTLFNAENTNFIFTYKDTFYGEAIIPESPEPIATAVIKTVVYVKEDAADIPKAIKDRLGKYFEVESVEEDGTLEATINSIKSMFGNEWDETHTESTSAAYNTNRDDYITTQWNLITTGDKGYGSFILSDKILPNVYNVTFKNGMQFLVYVMKDNAKANDERKIVSNDLSTGVEFSTDGVIPLDTLIQVARITTGDEYDKIVKILKNTNVDMFDIKLYSGSNETFITKLDNGKFRIKLPIKEEFKGKELKVYYVGDDDKVEEYAVTISNDGNYAIFETDHFSIYTLAAGAAIKNPKTGDNLVLYMLMLVGSAYALYKVKKFN